MLSLGRSGDFICGSSGFEHAEAWDTAELMVEIGRDAAPGGRGNGLRMVEASSAGGSGFDLSTFSTMSLLGATGAGDRGVRLHEKSF